MSKIITKDAFFYESTAKTTAFRYKEDELISAVKNMRRLDHDAELMKKAYEKKRDEFRDARIRCQTKTYELIPYTKRAVDNRVTLDFVFETQDPDERKIISEIKERVRFFY